VLDAHLAKIAAHFDYVTGLMLSGWRLTVPRAVRSISS
jgi:hypothetical protein